jgi:hypothetical protein
MDNYIPLRIYLVFPRGPLGMASCLGTAIIPADGPYTLVMEGAGRDSMAPPAHRCIVPGINVVGIREPFGIGIPLLGCAQAVLVTCGAVSGGGTIDEKIHLGPIMGNVGFRIGYRGIS